MALFGVIAQMTVGTEFFIVQANTFAEASRLVEETLDDPACLLEDSVENIIASDYDGITRLSTV